MAEFVIKMAILLTPMYIANSTAMLFGGKHPVDFGKKFFDGKQIFGAGKTFEGAITGILLGSGITLVIFTFFKEYTFILTHNYLLLGFLLSLGAITGDIAASFFKRRSDIPQGTPVLFLDQLDFVIGALIFGSLIFVPSFFETIIIAVTTLVSHKLANYLAFKVKLKKVPW